MVNDLEGALPIIVTNYARAFGVKVRIQGNKAYTNGSVITIPRLDLRDPVTSRMAYGYLAHESAHVRYSDFQAVHRIRRSYLLHTMVNIIEDARIERLIGRQFVGVWENLELLRSGEKEAYEDFLYKVPAMGTLQQILAFILFYTGAYCQRFKVLRPRAAHMLRVLRGKMDHATLSEICRLSLKVLDAENTSDVIFISKEIINTINVEGVLTKQKRGDLQSYQNIYDRLKCQPVRKKLSSKKGASAGKEKKIQKVLMRKFCRELEQAEEMLKRGTGDEISKIAPGIDHAVVVDQRGRNEMGSRDDLGTFETGQCNPGRDHFIDNVKSSARLRRELAAMVRAYIDDYGNTASKGTRLNPYRLALVPVGESRIFLDHVTVRDNSTSVHLLVDSSGSMLTYDNRRVLTRCEAACRSALSLALALEGIDGIHTMCSFFPGSSKEVDVCLKYGQRASERQAYFDQNPHGSTPLAQAIWHAISCAEEIDTARHVVIVITDGIPNSVGQARSALASARERGVEIFGIGICLEFIKTLIPRSYVISDPSEVLNAVFSLFSKIITPMEGQ